METALPETWHIQLFARLHASGAFGAIDRFPTQMTGGLLAQLALAPGARYTREQLIVTFWPDADVASGRNRLSLAVSWLRGHLEPPGVPRGSVLDADRWSVCLQPNAVATDVAAFDAACAAAEREKDPADRLRALHEAAGLYTGDLLPGFYEEGILQERERLREALIGVLRQAATLHGQRREYAESIDCLERALTVDPLREETHEDLIRMLASSGRASAAIRRFQALERLLAEEYDSAPSAGLRALIERLRADPAARAPARATAAEPARPAPLPPPLQLPPLPRTLTRFFGRAEEIRRVRALLGSPVGTEPVGATRLVTLVGSGGSGKTRLALEIAQEIAREIEDVGAFSVAFVSLADVNDPDAVAERVADALRLPPGAESSPVERIEAALATRPLLLLLDNAEHVLAGVSALVHLLLERLPYLSLLVTSRQRLGVAGEQEIPVPPLPTLAANAPATPEALLAVPSVQLFVDRARSVRPSFALTEQNALPVASLCRDLEGIPLAIELCAAWASLLTPAQMREKLERRFDFLVSHRTDIAPRHRTLRAALEYSFVLLPDPLRPAFRALSVFRGGWTLEAAEAVCAGIPVSALNALAELAARSLIFADTDAGGSGDGCGEAMRYRMLETIRTFSAEQLVYREAGERRRAHAVYCLQLAEQAESKLYGPDQEVWLARIDRDRENMQAALEWASTSGEREVGLRLASALHQYWYIRGYLKEGCAWLAGLLQGTTEREGDAVPLPESVMARSWTALGHLRWCQGDYASARLAHERVLEMSRRKGDARAIARSLNYLGITLLRMRELEEAERLLQESLDVASAAGDRSGVGRAFANLGNVVQMYERYDEAEELFERSLAVFRELGDRQRMADMLSNLGTLSLLKENYTRAMHLIEEALRIRRELGDRFGEAIALGYRGAVLRRLGETDRAEAMLTEGIRLSYEMGNRYIIAVHLVEVGLLAAGREQWRRAVFLIAAGAHLSERIGSSLPAVSPEEYRAALSAAEKSLGADEYRDAAAYGRAAPLAQAVANALPGGKGDEIISASPDFF